MKMPNRNQIMILIGLVVTQGPAIKSVADWLSGLGIPRLSSIVSFLGWLATAMGSAALAWPGIRSWLATLGLTTPPGALAPWIPGKPGDPAAGAVPAQSPDPTPVTIPIRPPTPRDPTA